MARSKRPIDGRQALHEISAAVNQLTYMEEHTNRLLEIFDVAIEQTYAKSPKRKQSYQLNRAEQPNPQERERLLEKAIWKQWGNNRGGDIQKFSVGCTCIQTYQMPLQGTWNDKNWGKVDLIGVSPSGLPVVIELKRERSPETPLRMLVEGLAYAIAVRRAWNEGHLREQWGVDVARHPIDSELPDTLLQVPIIGLAPKQYWKTKIGQPGVRSAGKVPESAWKPFHRLMARCKDRGFPVCLLSCDSSGKSEAGLPLVGHIARVTLPK